MQKEFFKMQHDALKTPIGWVTVTEENNHDINIKIHDVNPNSLSKKSKKTKNFYDLLTQYFIDPKNIDNFPFPPCGTDFQQKTWKALMSIPPGKTVSYQDIANQIGNSKAVRAIGQAVHYNPLPILIPCHRVINKNGQLGGYAYGLERKIWLLQHEGAIKK